MARRPLATLALCAAAHVSFVSCNGSEFIRAGSDVTGDGAKASSGDGGMGGKGTASAGSSQGGKGNGGKASGGASTSGGEGEASAGEASAGEASGSGGAPFVPGFQPPTEQLLYWFSADVGTTVEAGGVTAWKNRANNGMNAVQVQASMQPTLMQATLVPVPLLSFDGEDDHLELPELDANFEAGLSVFVVAVASAVNVTVGSAVDTCAAFIELSNGGEIDDIHIGAHGNTALYEVYQTVLQSEAGSLPIADVRLIEAHHGPGLDDQAPVELRINGGQAGSTVMPLPATVPRGWNYLGRSLYETCATFSGGLAELLLYSRKVTLEERTAIELYLRDKWQCCE
jgi:hypothetical protein